MSEIEKQIHELRLEIAKNLTVDQVIEITEAQVRAEQERDKYKKYIKETLQENWCFSDKEVEEEYRRILKGEV